MIEMLTNQKKFINFDETSIQFSCATKFSWEKPRGSRRRLISKEFQSVSMIAAIASDGEVFFQFLRGYCNEASVCTFIFDLVHHLDSVKPDWRRDHILLLDNSATHKTKTVIEVIRLLGVPTMYSAPASYLAIPIDRWSGALKAKDYEG
jgi:hypothetical protein